MKKSAHNFRTKEEKFLRLYSEWQETRRVDLQRQCISLLGELQSMNPRYNIRREFQHAF